MNSQFIPKWIAWEITRRCNLKCIHCRSSSDITYYHDSWTLKEAFSLIDNIVTFSSPVLVLSGGEPLLHENIWDIAQYGTSKGLRMCMATNGTLVSDEICLKMKEVGIKIVSLSLDGSSPKTHDDFRNQEGSFDAVISATTLLKKHKIEFIINSSFTKRNQNEIPQTYKLAKKIGAIAWYMFMVVPTGRGEEIISELISKEDYEKILLWHYETEKKEDKMLMRPTCAPHYYRILHQKSLQEGEKIKRRNLKFSTGSSKGCICGQLIGLIDYKGNLFPCSYLPISAGNVKESSFKEIWENSPLLNSLRDTKNYKGKCRVCEYINICGGCRARADAIEHDYLEEEPFCTYLPKRYKISKLILV